MAHVVLFLFAQGREAAARGRIEKDRIVAKASSTKLVLENITVDGTRGGDWTAPRCDECQRANETGRAAIGRHAPQVCKQRRAPLWPGDIGSPEARRVY